MKTLLKWLARILGVLVLIVVIVVLWIYFASESKINHTYDFEVTSLTLPPADSLTLATGHHLVQSRGCMDCHGANLAGRMFLDGMPMARIRTPNLTPAGLVADFTTDDWVRALRHGVDPEGKPFWIMPSDAYARLSREDLAAIIVYIKHLEPIESEPFEREVGPIGRMLIATGGLVFPVAKADHSRPFPVAPPVGPTVEYGDYLVGLCRHCHGENLSGGLKEGDPDAPASANLTPGPDGIGSYTKETFTRALRTGVKADGSVMNPEYMPWTSFAHLTDNEISAAWAYLRTIPPLPDGP